jgi:hypothetical protein
MVPMTDREARVAKNEVLFRGVNERVDEVKGELQGAGGDEKIDFICECGRTDCIEQVQLTRIEYGRVRENPAQFIVKPGHEVNEVEGVVREGDGYVVVEKHPEEAQLARETDPRS